MLTGARGYGGAASLHGNAGRRVHGLRLVPVKRRRHAAATMVISREGRAEPNKRPWSGFGLPSGLLFAARCLRSNSAQQQLSRELSAVIADLRQDRDSWREQAPTVGLVRRIDLLLHQQGLRNDPDLEWAEAELREIGRQYDGRKSSQNYETLPGQVPRCSLERKFSHREHELPCTCPVRTDGVFLFWTTPQGPHAVRDCRCPLYRARTKGLVESPGQLPSFPQGSFFSAGLRLQRRPAEGRGRSQTPKPDMPFRVMIA